MSLKHPLVKVTQPQDDGFYYNHTKKERKSSLCNCSLIYPLGLISFLALAGLLTYLVITHSNNITPLNSHSLQPNVTLYLIRHGEKITDADPNVSCAGWLRSNCLANFFSDTRSFNIQHLFAQNQDHKSSSCRAIQTLVPLSSLMKLDINTCFSNDSNGIISLVNALVKIPNGDILVAWEHANIALIVENILGTSAGVVSFPDAYNIVWKISQGNVLSIDSLVEPSMCTFPSSSLCKSKSNQVPNCGTYVSTLTC